MIDHGSSIEHLYEEASKRREPRLFTVMLPILRPPDMLPHAVRSVLAQTASDFELCIISDGAPERTVTRAHELAQSDSRIKVFSFPKGERNGELHRDAVLKGSSATYVAQLGDDDLWLPNHLASLAALLRKADFVSLPQVRVFENEEIYCHRHYSIGSARTRRRMLAHEIFFFGPTECGYRLAAYRKLESGWSPAPSHIYSDQFMWHKFFACNGLTYRTGNSVTSLKFSAVVWQSCPLDIRSEVIGTFAEGLADEASWKRFAQRNRIRMLRSQFITGPVRHLILHLKDRWRSKLRHE